MNYHIYMNRSLFILTETELLQWIFDGKLEPEAQIQKGFKEGWRLLCESPEWKLFHEARQDKKWVLLQKKGKTGVFKQKGPYSTAQIRFFLKKGLCYSSNFIWKKGFQEWKRISIISDFSTSPLNTIEDILTHQSRKYKNQKVKIVRYTPSRPSFDWQELQKSVYWKQSE